MQTEKFFQKMSDGAEIAVNRWTPDEKENVKAVIVLSHGMLEHSLRYDRVGSVFTESDYAFCGHDHRGHGKTAQQAELTGKGIFGKLADKDGFNRVTEDLHEVISKTREDFPGKKVFLLGHSFGSIISQNFIEKYGSEIDGVILCGTTGPMPEKSRAGKILTSLACLIHGKNYKSNFIQGIAFKGYNSRVTEKIVTGNEWISTSRMNQQMYEADAWCGGTATVSFFNDLLSGLCRIHKTASIKKIPKNLPVLFITGSQDPVGGYGSTVRRLAEIYGKNGIESVEMRFYENDRHEIFNEDDSDIVIKDVKDWIEAHL